jgi:hypothetical protein
MQGSLQETLPEMQQEMQQQQIKGRMNQQVQGVQKDVLENLAPATQQQPGKDQ